MFGVKGRAWLVEQDLPIDERITLDECLRQLDFHGDELAQVDRIIAERALHDPDARRLLTVPGSGTPAPTKPTSARLSKPRPPTDD